MYFGREDLIPGNDINDCLFPPNKHFSAELLLIMQPSTEGKQSFLLRVAHEYLLLINSHFQQENAHL